MKVVKLYITAVILALMVSTGAQAARPLDVAYSGAILEARAENIMGEMNFLVEETQGYVNFLAYLYGTGNTAISRPALDMKTFSLSWLQDVPAVSELNPNIQGSERIGEYPGKAAVVTGSRHFIDRMGLYRGQEINLSKYVVLDDFTGRLDLCVGIAIPEALKNYFPAPYLVRTQDGTLYATRMIVVPTGYSDIDLSSFLSTSGGNFSGIMDGSASRITADFLKYGDEQRDKVNTSTMYELLIGLFDKGQLYYADLPPAIWTLHETLVNRYADDILKKTGTVVLKRSLAEDPDLQSFLSYVQTLYFTSQEVDGKLDSLSSVVVNNQQFRDMLKTGINTAVRNGITLRDIKLDDIEWTRRDASLPIKISASGALTFDSVDLRGVEMGWSKLREIKYKNGYLASKTIHLPRVTSTSYHLESEGFDSLLKGKNIYSSANRINFTGTTKSISMSDVYFSSLSESPITFKTSTGQGPGLYHNFFRMNGAVTFEKTPVYDKGTINSYDRGIQINSLIKSGGNNIASINSDGDLVVSNITIPDAYYHRNGNFGSVRFNGRAIIRDKVESVDVSDVNGHIPIYALGFQKGSLSEAEINDIAVYIKNNLYGQANYIVMDYIFSVLYDKFIFKSSIYGKYQNTKTPYHYSYDIEDLISYFSNSPKGNEYDIKLKYYNPEFYTEQISAFVGSVTYEISGEKYNILNYDQIFTSIMYDNHGADEYTSFLKLPKFLNMYSLKENNAFYPFTIRNGNDISVFTELKDYNGWDGQNFFSNYTPNWINASGNYIFPSSSQVDFLSDVEFNNLEMEEPLVFQFSDTKFIVIPSFKLYITPRTVFLAR